jgi:uncharacterized protein YrzB (UPF0473 family)
MGDYGNDFVVLTDDNGNEYELEHIDTVEKDGVFYLAFLPADMEEDDESYGMVILKTEPDDDGEEILVSVDDEAELDEVYAQFLERLLEDDDDDEDTP